MTSLNRTFTPGWPLTIFVIVCLAILLSLGTWQARKIGPKTALLDRVEAGLASAPMPLNDLLAHTDSDAMEYRRVSFSGEALSRQPLMVFATNLKGKSGYHLYLPYHVDKGKALLVNLGWVPAHLRESFELPTSLPKQLSGVIRSSAEPGSMAPPNDAEKGNWFTANVDEMAAAYGLPQPGYYPFRLFADHVGTADNLPQGGQVRVDIPNDHLEYALTWFGLAAALIGVYVVFGFRERKSEAR